MENWNYMGTEIIKFGAYLMLSMYDRIILLQKNDDTSLGNARTS